MSAGLCEELRYWNWVEIAIVIFKEKKFIIFINDNMKFIAALIITALLSFIAGLYLPWWGIAIAAFIVALLVYQKAGMAFLSGFLGLFFL